MSIKNLLVFIMLVNYGSCYIIRDGIVREADIPKINVKNIVGEWHLLASNVPEDQTLCTSYIVEQEYADAFVMNMTAVFESGINSVTLENQDIFNVSVSMNAVMSNGVDSFLTQVNDIPGPLLTIFDAVYDSYMAIYLVYPTGVNYGDSEGSFFILSRERTLPDEIFNKVKESSFYQERADPESGLVKQDYRLC